jgi:HEAT repeat protein
MSNKNFNVRLAALSCLAFLQSEESKKALKEIALYDVDSGVRQSALWAYGFSNREEAKEFIENRSFQDVDYRVRDFAKHLANHNFENWFRSS